MHVVAMAWIYVALMMAVVEALSPDGGVMGAIITFVLYGLMPLAIVLYILGAPARRRARRRKETSAADADGSGHASGDSITPKREEP